MVPFFFYASWIKKVTSGSEDEVCTVEMTTVSLKEPGIPVLDCLCLNIFYVRKKKKSYLVQVISPPYMEPNLTLTHMPFWKWETWCTEVEYLACVTKLIRGRDF